MKSFTNFLIKIYKAQYERFKWLLCNLNPAVRIEPCMQGLILYKKMIKICEHCGKEYDTYKKNSRFCSNFCYNQYKIQDDERHKNLCKKFIEKAQSIHGDKYDYSLVNYKDSSAYVKIICKKHGIFEQMPKKHLQGHGCPKCAKSGVKYTTADIIKKFKEVHGDLYDYNLVDYINARTKVKIVCPKHGVFEQAAYSHLQGHGCPMCRESKGEKIILEYLLSKGLKIGEGFFREYKFDRCKDVFKLPFDFYIPSVNTCIEFQGNQHYTEGFWSSYSEQSKYGLDYVQKHDKIKFDFCENNNINLIILNYKDFMYNCKLVKSKIFMFLESNLCLKN